jgi:hypothetical protein
VEYCPLFAYFSCFNDLVGKFFELENFAFCKLPAQDFSLCLCQNVNQGLFLRHNRAGLRGGRRRGIGWG